MRQALRSMDQSKIGPDEAINRVAVDTALGTALEQRENVEGKLTSLEKYTARLEVVAEWLSSAKNKLSAPNQSSTDSIIAEVIDRESEIKEVLGNFTNLEKECNVVEQTVSPQLQVFILNSLLLKLPKFYFCGGKGNRKKKASVFRSYAIISSNKIEIQ